MWASTFNITKLDGDGIYEKELDSMEDEIEEAVDEDTRSKFQITVDHSNQSVLNVIPSDMQSCSESKNNNNNDYRE